MSLLPSRLHVTSSPDEPQVLDMDGDNASAAFDALGSETARNVLAALYEEPRTPPEIREVVGTSLQNVHYHLDRLEDAGLITGAGTGYSAKGNEMTVYAPASEAVVLFAGRDADGSRLRDVLARLFGLFVTVALSTLVFAVATEWWQRRQEAGAERLDDAEYQLETATATTQATGVDPVIAFFLGGCAVVALVGVWWLLRARLRSRRASRFR